MNDKEIEKITGIENLRANDTMEKRNVMTLAHLKDLWEKNILDNKPYIKHDIIELWNDFQVIDGTLVSAGPSLKNSLDEIRKGNMEICAVDMAAKYLIENGIEPRYIVCSEAKPEASKILNFDCVIPLICDVVTNPEIIKNWKGEKYFYVAMNNCIDLDNNNQLFSERHTKLSGIETKLVLGGNVGSAGLSFLLSVRNCRKVYLYGHDFGWHKDEEFYCGGIQNELAQKRIQSEKQSGTLYEKKDINGNTIYTNMSLLTFLNWYREAKQRYPEAIVNRSGAGLLN